MVRATILCIVGDRNINGRSARELLYEQYKDHIPVEFKKGYIYKTGGQLNLPLEPDSEVLNQAMATAKEYGLHPSRFSEPYYTPRELDRMPFFWLYLPDPLELEGEGAVDYGTQYETYCPQCGFCQTLSSDILVDRKFVRRYKIATLVPDVYVSAEVKDLIESAGFTGVSFDFKVLDYKHREIPDLYVMTVHNVLPPLSDTTWMDRSSRSCGHDVLRMRSDLQYEKEKLEGALDFNLTAECLNNDQARQVIISARVRNLFRKHRIYSRYLPVTLL